jgi:hypothetical protein
MWDNYGCSISGNLNALMTCVPWRINTAVTCGDYLKSANFACLARKDGIMGGPILHSTYDYPLVALSVLIAIAASYAGLTLAERVSLARNQARTAWLFGGAVAMGTGIWSMHYTGMIAYRLPLQVYCHVPTVLLSLLAAIGASLLRKFRFDTSQALFK